MYSQIENIIKKLKNKDSFADLKFARLLLLNYEVPIIIIIWIRSVLQLVFISPSNT